MNLSDTVYALASGSGPSAISVIRLSGSLTKNILDSITGGEIAPRRYSVRKLVSPETGEVLDEAVVMWLPGPGSFTGEDSAELHVHSSRAVVSGVLATLAAWAGARLAEPGEFARRAFLNGKMDLVEVEGLADLLSASTAVQRRRALRMMGGRASSIFDSWRERLLTIRSSIEAVVDFADEEGVAEVAAAGIDREIEKLLFEMSKAVRDSGAAEIVRDGVRVVIAGFPNTGKSSLLNAVAGREAAIVSSIPGTTRDVIEVALEVGGIPVVLTDTAGLRDQVFDEVEREGVSRTRGALAAADVVVWVFSPDIPGSDEYDGETTPDMLVSGKSDLAGSHLGLSRNDSIPGVALSARTGLGIGGFISHLSEIVASRFAINEDAIVVSARQREATVDSIRSLNDSLLHNVEALELKAEDIRRAAEAIGRITGRTEVEEWLGVIFSRFCIGK
jgi:tRNA modification GTPase